MAEFRPLKLGAVQMKYSPGLVIVGALLLSGCASYNYALDEYGGIPVVSHEYQGNTYRVFDKPASSKLMITPSLGSAAGDGFVRGLTFGLVDTEVPQPVYRAAAESYLASLGKKCTVDTGQLVVRPQWEFRYQCQAI